MAYGCIYTGYFKRKIQSNGMGRIKALRSVAGFSRGRLGELLLLPVMDFENLLKLVFQNIRKPEFY
jgi:hypothetical protein